MTEPSSARLCPRCGERRIGAFRYCRGCGLDYDGFRMYAPAARPVEPVAPSPPEPVAAPATPRPVPVQGGRRSQAKGFLTVGAVILVGLAALSNLTVRTSDDPRAAGGDPSSGTAADATPPSPGTADLPKLQAAALAPTGPTQDATVLRVTDGDTIVVDIDGTEHRVRYIGMDTPEPDDEDPEARALAEAATEANRQLVEGQDVVLERDVSDTDAFDRLLRNAWVTTSEGEQVMVGLELVRHGLAQVSTYPPDVAYVDMLTGAQEEARREGRGRWASDAGAAPPSPVTLVDDAITAVGADERTRFKGAAGTYTWNALAVAGSRMTVRWVVNAGDAACRIRWRVEPTDGEPITSRVRVAAGGREADNRRYDIDFEDATFTVDSTCPTWVMTMQTASAAPADDDCDPSYPDVCIPPYPPDLDCGDIEFRRFEVRGSDPHGFDQEGDGVACES